MISIKKFDGTSLSIFRQTLSTEFGIKNLIHIKLRKKLDHFKGFLLDSVKHNLIF